VDSPFVVAISVFLGIYLTFFLIRLVADMVIIGIAFVAAFLAYNIQNYYSEFLTILKEVNLLEKLGITLSETADPNSIWIIAVLIAITAILLCLPFLPFSATYRQMLGVEKPQDWQQARIKAWIREEISYLPEKSPPIPQPTDNSQDRREQL